MQDHTPLNPRCITDHRGSSVHFNILFIPVYRCALLERRCAHEPAESHTSVHARATATRPENHEELSNNVRQEVNRSVILDVICFHNFGKLERAENMQREVLYILNCNEKAHVAIFVSHSKVTADFYGDLRC